MPVIVSSEASYIYIRGVVIVLSFLIIFTGSNQKAPLELTKEAFGEVFLLII